MSAPIFSNNGDFATRIAGAVTTDLMTLQVDSSTNIESTATKIVSDPLLPDRTVSDRLAHMDPELFDLSETSHLMKLLKVLLGGAGAGGVRKQIAVARLQNSFHGMHFLDLDRFYGALFGIRRTQAELMPDFGTQNEPAIFDPYTDAAGSDAWDDVHSRDASYRDRLIKFARALPLGGTYAGLRAAAEALLSVECEIYESWGWVDEQNALGTAPKAVTYSFTTLGVKYGTWAKVEQDRTWRNLEAEASTGKYFLGRTGQKNRGEVVIQPKRRIEPGEQFQTMRVMDKLKPAGTQVTVNPEGLAIHQAVPVRGVAADSEYWEVNYKVNPAPVLVSPTPSTPVYQQDPKDSQPRPALSQYQGEFVVYNNEIVQVWSYKMIDYSMVDNTDYVTLVFEDDVRKPYPPSYAVMDGQKALAGRIVADGVLTSFSYAPRTSATALKNASNIKVKVK